LVVAIYYLVPANELPRVVNLYSVFSS